MLSKKTLKGIAYAFIAFGLLAVLVNVIYQPRFYSKYNQTKKSGLTAQTTDYSIVQEKAQSGGNTYTISYNFTVGGAEYHQYNPVKISTPTIDSPLEVKYLANDPGFNYPVVQGASVTADHNTEIAISGFIFIFGTALGGFLIWLSKNPGRFGSNLTS